MRRPEYKEHPRQIKASSYSGLESSEMVLFKLSVNHDDGRISHSRLHRLIGEGYAYVNPQKTKNGAPSVLDASCADQKEGLPHSSVLSGSCFAIAVNQINSVALRRPCPMCG